MSDLWDKKRGFVGTVPAGATGVSFKRFLREDCSGMDGFASGIQVSGVDADGTPIICRSHGMYDKMLTQSTTAEAIQRQESYCIVGVVSDVIHMYLLKCERYGYSVYNHTTFDLAAYDPTWIDGSDAGVRVVWGCYDLPGAYDKFSYAIIYKSFIPETYTLTIKRVYVNFFGRAIRPEASGVMYYETFPGGYIPRLVVGEGFPKPPPVGFQEFYKNILHDTSIWLLEMTCSQEPMLYIGSCENGKDYPATVGTACFVTAHPSGGGYETLTVPPIVPVTGSGWIFITSVINIADKLFYQISQVMGETIPRPGLSECRLCSGFDPSEYEVIESGTWNAMGTGTYLRTKNLYVRADGKVYDADTHDHLYTISEIPDGSYVYRDAAGNFPPDLYGVGVGLPAIVPTSCVDEALVML